MVGNTPNYVQLDILRCFFRLQKPTSRQALSIELELGEGTVKAILALLKNSGITSSTKEGHELNASGKNIISEILKLITLPRQISYTDFYSDLLNSAIQLKRGKLHENTKEAIDTVNVRDIAVRNGADAAFVLFYKDGALKMSKNDTYTFKELQRQFELQEGDIVLISFAKTRRKAELGVLAQAVLSSPAFAALIGKKLNLRVDLKWYYK